jgi:ATP-dependent RNA helicase DeaD
VEPDEREAGGISRGQNVVYVTPHDWTSIGQFLSPAIERLDEANPVVQLLVITSDADVAAVTAAAAVKLSRERNLGIVAATSARRAASLLRAGPAQIVAGTPETIVALLKATALKVDGVRAACIVWADELVTRGGSAVLETVMAELPKDGARIVVTAELTASVEDLLERYARRARRVVAVEHESDRPVNLEYVTVSAHARLSSLRRLIDEADPRSAVVFVRDSESRPEVRDLLHALGYAGDSAAVRIGLVAPPDTDLVVLFDLPASREELREVAGGAKRLVALVQPRQLGSLRSLAATGAVKPFTLPESGLRARDRDELARAELREVLSKGQFGRELLSLEPLLDDFDGIEIAAAALQLLHAERSVAAAAFATAPAAPRDRPAAAMTRLFISVGSRDHVRPGDLVGAIANQAGVTSASIGKVDVRESHSVVEVSPDITELVIEKVTGTEIRGRRAIVRRDEERQSRGADRARAPRAAAAPRTRGRE